MKIGACEQIAGTTTAIPPGALNGTVKVHIGDGTIVKPNDVPTSK